MIIPKTILMNNPIIFFCLDAGYLNSLAFIFALINTSNILTCSKKFLDFLQQNLFNNNKITYIGAVSIRNTCIKAIYAKSTCIKDTDIKDFFFARNVDVKSFCAIKYSKIYLQLF